jgi:hypothetical protein
VQQQQQQMLSGNGLLAAINAAQQQQGGAGNVLVPPQQQQQQQQQAQPQPPDITVRIAAAATPSELLEIAAEKGMGLFTEHLCLVMYRLAQLRAAGTVVDTAQQQLQDLLGLCRSRAASMGPKQLAEVIWALAQVRARGWISSHYMITHATCVNQGCNPNQQRTGLLREGKG